METTSAKKELSNPISDLISDEIYELLQIRGPTSRPGQTAQALRDRSRYCWTREKSSIHEEMQSTA